MKSFFEKFLCLYVRWFFRLHPKTKLIAVVGSVGKTSVKTALSALFAGESVRASRGNFNTTLSAPLEILGIEQPSSIRSPFSWLRIAFQGLFAVLNPKAPRFIIQEFGIDHPGEMDIYMRYVRPAVAVVSAIAPEHMEFFCNLDTVAQEELKITQISQKTVLNATDVPKKYHHLVKSELATWGKSKNHDLRVTFQMPNILNGHHNTTFTYRGDAAEASIWWLSGEHLQRSIITACLGALEVGLPLEKVAGRARNITPAPGRMQPLAGTNNSTLLDDTYNSSPRAAEQALKTLYAASDVLKGDRFGRCIAILGDMNELGDTSEAEHRAIGRLCDPERLRLLVTVGDQARKFIAPEAEKRGVATASFDTAIQAGEFTKSKIQPNDVILLKGSQGGIYLEEATKLLLANPEHATKLVRQSKDWLKKKSGFFKS